MLKTLFKSTVVAVACFASLAGACATNGRSPGKPGAPIRVESAVLGTLRPGQAGEIIVTLRPATSVDRLRVTFRPEAGLTLQSNQSQWIIVSAAAGVPLTYHLTVVAANEGQFRISAVIRAEISGATSGRVVSIPVIVGDPSKIQKPQAIITPPVDATGERIKSLPAIERTR